MKYLYIIFILLIGLIFQVSADSIILDIAHDGYPVDWTTTGSFETLRGGSGTYAYNSVALSEYQLVAGTTENNFDKLYRDIYTFDTSSITENNTITSATLQLYYYYKLSNLGTPNYGITKATPSNPLSFIGGDYTEWYNTRLCNDIEYSTFDEYHYYNFSFNSNGISSINKSGYSCFMGRLSWDIDNSFTGSWSSGATSGIRFYQSGSGSSYWPKLIIEYSPAITPTPTTSIPTTTPTTNPTTTYFPGYYPSLELGTSLFFQCITMIFIFFSSDPGIWFIALAIALIFLALFKRILYMQTRRK